MSITKTNLYNSDKTVAAENLYSYLMDVAYPKYFDGISIDMESNEIVCTVDSTQFLKITNLTNDGTIAFTVTTKNGTTTSSGLKTTSALFEYAYSCENGIIFTDTNLDSNKGTFGICKTNSGDTVIIFPRGSSSMTSTSSVYCILSAENLCAISVCDDTLYAFNVKRCSATVHMTSLAPIPTNCIDGRYCKDVFYMPFCENTAIGVLNINGVNYLSNGFWCVKDE